MRIVNLGLYQTLTDSRTKVPEAFSIQQLISVSIDAFDVILEPMYTKFLTFSMYLSSYLIVGEISVPWLRT